MDSEFEVKFRDSLKKLKAEVWKYPNVVGISNTPKRKIVKGVETDVPCIRVYVTKKLPKDKLKPSEVIPEEVNGVKTDVVEIGTLRKMVKPEEFRLRYRPFPCGVSTSRADEVARGTVGFYIITEDFNVYLISNNHVWAKENDGKIFDPITQPGLLDGGDPSRDIVARLEGFIPIDFSGNPNYVDVAWASLIDPSLAYYGILGTDGVTGLSRIYVKSSVEKYGASTGKTTGTIIDESATVSVKYDKGNAVFEDVVIVKGENFVAPGDSGSPVIDGSKSFVGLLFAGSEDGSHGVVCKHDRIVDAIGKAIAKRVSILAINVYQPYAKIEVVKRVASPPSEMLPYILMLIIGLIR